MAISKKNGTDIPVQYNESIEVFYDLEGDLIGKSKKMAFDKLPKNAIEISSLFQLQQR